MPEYKAKVRAKAVYTIRDVFLPNKTRLPTTPSALAVDGTLVSVEGHFKEERILGISAGSEWHPPCIERWSMGHNLPAFDAFLSTLLEDDDD